MIFSSTVRHSLSMRSLFLLIFVPAIYGQSNTGAIDPCEKAPPAAKAMCQQINRWDEKARKAAAAKKTTLPPGLAGAVGNGFAADFAPIASSIYECMSLDCMCTYLRGSGGSNRVCTLPNGKALTKAIRKEYRMMTDDERQRYHNAVRVLKQTGEFDKLARIHSAANSGGGAHSGPAFLPWHREFTKRVEMAVRQVDATLYLPYWDSSLDQALPNARDSVLFTADLMGESDAQGNVVNGPFYPWRTLQGRGNLQRNLSRDGALFSPDGIGYLLGKQNLHEIMAFTLQRPGCNFRIDYNSPEYMHGGVHMWVGGDMFDTATSANDPIFYLHHCFVDSIWEQWRQSRQSRADRELQFPADNAACSSPQHFAAQNLAPFVPIKNMDGISNLYTDNLFEYAPRPQCSQQRPDCGSRFLFCDMSHGTPRCSSKMKVGSACGMYQAGENPCYNGMCSGGQCVLTQNTPPPTTPPPVTMPPNTNIQPQESCFNENQCCGLWAQNGECQRNTGYMGQWCKASCGICHPRYQLVDDCSDRHQNCPIWSRTGECTKNTLWMSENCRRSCNKCSQSRARECQSGQQARQQQQTFACENSPGCYNENVCCTHWAQIGECRNNMTWMACNCRVSCGHCNPDYNFGTCNDYHKDCAYWQRTGQCQKNPWMPENCRQSCQTCHAPMELRQMCGNRAGAVEPLAPARQQWNQQGGNWNQNNQWGQQEGNWGGTQRSGFGDYDERWGGSQGGNRWGWGK